MRGKNIIWAAAVLAVGLVAGCGVLVLGFRWVVADATGRLVTAVERHGVLTRQAGANAGLPIEQAVNRLTAQVDVHGKSITDAGRTIAEGATAAGQQIAEGATTAGRTIGGGAVVAGRNIREGATTAGREISKPHVTMEGPVPIVDQQPLRIEGTAPDGSLPVDAELGGQEPRKR
jgi:hypothetical protein